MSDEDLAWRGDAMKLGQDDIPWLLERVEELAEICHKYHKLFEHTIDGCPCSVCIVLKNLEE